MEIIDRHFATDKEDLDNTLDIVKEEQRGCDVTIKVIRDDMGGYWVEVYV